MDKKELIAQFLRFLKQSVKQGPKPQAGLAQVQLKKGALGSKAHKLVGGVKVATAMVDVLMGLTVTEALATKMHQLIPHTTEGLEWLHALPQKIANQTIGRIPILGSVYRWLNNAVAEGAAKVATLFGAETVAAEIRNRKMYNPDQGFNASVGDKNQINEQGDENMSKTNRKLINGPSFYENLDFHKSFSIPGAYTKKTVINGTLATPKIAVHRIFENPMPDKSAVIDRVNQKFSLIKAVRGLSATRYDILDLFNYERFAKLILLQYYVVKKVVQAAKTYSLVQTAIGDNIMSGLGFNPTEVRTNLANYETLLCQIHRFISNNLPISGTWIKRLEYLVGANIPDYSDAKVATIHMFAVSMASVFYDRENPSNAHTFDCIPNANNNDYATLLANFSNYQVDIVNNDNWQQLIADYFGAFGGMCMWQDSDYPSYATPLNLRNSDNDLCREQVKNGMYLNAKVTLITVNAGVANVKIRIDVDDPTPLQLPSYQFPGTYDATVASGATTLSYTNILDNDAYLNVMSSAVTVASLGANNYLLTPDHNGVGAQSVPVTTPATFINMGNHETIYTLHKDSYSEGEALEISQFKARSIGLAAYLNDAQDRFSCGYMFKTHEYAIMDTFIYTFGSNGSAIVDQTYIICDEALCDDDLTSVESAIDFPDEIMCWALIDWMPLAHMTFYGFNAGTSTYSPRDIALIDMDSFGSLDDRAFATSINYSIYSLLGAGLTVGKKRVDNLGSVYKDKPSKKA